MPPRLVRSAAGVAAVVLATLLAAAPAAADTSDFTFDSFTAGMLLSRGADGHAELAVTETIVARFPDADQNRGIVRAIPDDDGDVPLRTEIVSVTDGAGTDIPYEVTRDDGFVEVATGDDSFVRGVQTYVISYTQRDSIRAFADTGADEFYRDINGTGWEQPFGEVTATLSVDATLAAALTGDTACYVGGEGSTDRCTIAEQTDADGAGFLAGATDLGPGENVTVAIGFAPGTFVPGEPVRSPAKQFAIDAAPALAASAVAAALLPIAAVVAAAVVHRRRRDAPGRGTITPQYDPPRGLDVLAAATLLGRGQVGLSAAIVDLAVSGHLRIVETGDAYRLDLVAPADDPARREVLDAVFGADAAPGTAVALGGDTTALAARLAPLLPAAAVRLRTTGLREKRPMRGWGLMFTAVLVGFVAALALVVFTATTGTLSPVAAVALPVAFSAGIVALIIWPYGDRLTDTGAAARDHLTGLRDYLRLAETDRIRMLQSPVGAERTALPGTDAAAVLHLYEKLLPYAIIWGVETEWSAALEARAAGTDLGWYAGPRGFTSTYFLASLAVTHTSASTTAQTWAGSGGSSLSGGSFGGGFSGGGAGGGGGGGR